MVRTQILVPRWGAEQGFQRCFVAVDVTYQGLVLSLAQVRLAVFYRTTRPKVQLTFSLKQTFYEVRAEHKWKKGKKT